MRALSHKTIVLLIGLFSLSLLSGCTNWEKKYQALLVEHENLKGQLEHERGEKGELASRISQDQQLIEELQRQIEQQRKTPADASGFGEGYDVAFDPDAGTITVTLPNAILFDSGKATLKSATSAELDHIRSVLREKYNGKKIDVVGHTDTDPIRKTKDQWKDNWELSAERALTVTRYLIQRGIAEDLIRAVGCGESRPIASNSTSSGKAKNRRVEIVVHIKG
ncbi:MAG: OmpA family protein [Sedimentisphaerales bacterium]|nr:OmpA family protein [Sedimentisphaerales bacterium]